MWTAEIMDKEKNAMETNIP